MFNPEEIPQEVRDLPANEDGDGFIINDLHTASTVGPDGRIYTRKQGVITVDDQNEGDEG